MLEDGVVAVVRFDRDLALALRIHAKGDRGVGGKRNIAVKMQYFRAIQGDIHALEKAGRRIALGRRSVCSGPMSALNFSR